MMAKDVVRMRSQMANFYKMKAQMQSVGMQMQASYLFSIFRNTTICLHVLLGGLIFHCCLLFLNTSLPVGSKIPPVGPLLYLYQSHVASSVFGKTCAVSIWLFVMICLTCSHATKAHSP